MSSQTESDVDLDTCNHKKRVSCNGKSGKQFRRAVDAETTSSDGDGDEAEEKEAAISPQRRGKTPAPTNTYGKRANRLSSSASSLRHRKSPRYEDINASDMIASEEENCSPPPQLKVQSPAQSRPRPRPLAATSRPSPTPAFSNGRTLRCRNTIKVPSRGVVPLSEQTSHDRKDDEDEDGRGDAKSRPPPLQQRPRSPVPHYDVGTWGKVKLGNQTKALDRLHRPPERSTVALRQASEHQQQHPPLASNIYDLIQLQRLYIRAMGEKVGRTSQRGKVDEGNAVRIGGEDPSSKEIQATVTKPVPGVPSGSSQIEQGASWLRARYGAAGPRTKSSPRSWLLDYGHVEVSVEVQTTDELTQPSLAFALRTEHG